MLLGFAQSGPNSSTAGYTVGMTTRPQSAQDECLLLTTSWELDLFVLYSTGFLRVLPTAGAEASTGTPPAPQALLPWVEPC